METCESCKKSLSPSKMLKHIGNSKACKAYYGSRFIELKASKKSDRNMKNWNKIPRKKKDKINKLRRKKYVNDTEKRPGCKIFIKKDKL